MPRIVLFGESGFVGSNLLAFIRREMVAPTLEQANLTDKQSLRMVLQPEDIVINAAGYANATDNSSRGRALFQSINVDGVRNLAEVSAEMGVAQLIHISSVDAMGRLQGEGITEDMHSLPVTPYARSKRDGELILAEYRDRFPITILRPTSVFGERRGLAYVLCKIANLGLVPLPNAGWTLIPFTYIGNVARCIELCIGNEQCYGSIFIIGDHTSYELRQVLYYLARAMHNKLRVITFPYPLAYSLALISESLARCTGKVPIIDRARLHILSQSISYSINAFCHVTGYAQPYSIQAATERIVVDYQRHMEAK